jgi:hypothetical protein
MLVKFKSKTSADFIMFGDIAVALIRMMGHSGNVPGAMSAAELPAALARLKHALSGESVNTEPAADRPDEEAAAADQAVTLRQRAVPLIDMLTAAVAAESYIMWESA